MNLNSIPEELKNYPNWVCWGKPGENPKRPFNPLTGFSAKANDPETWAPYEKAVEAVRRGEYAGVGFQFGDTPFVGVDFDHCRDPGTEEINPHVLEWLPKLNSYTEISQSGTGFHIILRGELPTKIEDVSQNKISLPEWGEGVELEIYNTGRYFALTGDTPDPFPIADAGEALNALYSEAGKLYLERKKTPPQPVQPRTEPCSLSDAEVLEKARKGKNGADFTALYDRGDKSAYDGDDSRADLALCNHLAFWSGCDKGQMDRLFRRSALYRPKWDEIHDGKRTYGQMTIDKAVQDCKGVYSPSPAVRVESLFKPFEPFEEEPAVEAPRFPLEVFPEIIRDYAAAVAENLQLPPEFIAMPALCVAAAALQNKFVVNPKPDWYEPLPLWFIGIAEPSERKSAALAAVMRPAQNVMREIRDSMKEDVSKYRANLTMMEKRVQGLQKAAAAGEDPEAEKNYQNAFRELEELRENPVLPPSLFVDDITPEALSEVMADHHGCAAIFSAEGGIFDIIGGRYSDGKSNTDLLTKSFSGDSVQINRITRGKVEIARPALTLCLLIQPGIWEESVIGRKRFTAVGLPARALVCRPPMIVHRKYRTDPVPDKIRLSYEALCRRLLNFPYPGKGQKPVPIRFSYEACEMSESFFNKLEGPMREPGGELNAPGIREAAGKLHGITARIAAVMHICNHILNPTKCGVSVEEWEAARQIIEGYFIPQLQNLYGGGVGSSREESNAKYLWKKILSRSPNGEPISENDLFQSAKGRMGTAKKKVFMPALKELEERGYISIQLQKGEAGRPKRLLYINPEAILGI